MNHFDKISNYTKAMGIKAPEHPLFCFAKGDMNSCSNGNDVDFTADFYIISFKNVVSGTVQYGKTKYDHNSGKCLLQSQDKLLVAKTFV